MTKLLLLLALVALFPAAGQAKGRLYAAAVSTYPCETYEPNCDGQGGREGNDDWDGGEDGRPDDPNGPDYGGSDDEI
jgi:hypothetical protein